MYWRNKGISHQHAAWRFSRGCLHMPSIVLDSGHCGGTAITRLFAVDLLGQKSDDYCVGDCYSSWGGGGCTHVMHGRSGMTVDLRIREVFGESHEG